MSPAHVRGRHGRRMRLLRAAILIVVVVATAAVTATVQASLERSSAVLVGAPVRTTVVTNGGKLALTTRPISTLRSTTITVPNGERHLVVVRLSAQQECRGTTCQVRTVIGSGVATPGPLEVPADTLGALTYESVRGPFEAGSYSVSVQWGTVGGSLPMLAFPKGYAFVIEQIRVG
jgi:hypothetical protein